MTLGCVLAGLSPALGVLVFFALRAVIGPQNFTTLGYIALFPVAQIIGATLAFLAGYASYDLGERRKLNSPVILQGGFATLIIALPVYLGARGLLDEDVLTEGGQVVLMAMSVLIGLGALLLFVRAGQD